MNAYLIEKIEKYLDNEMEPQERKDFELQLENDGELNNNFHLYKSINNAMKEEDVSEEERELGQTIEQMNRKYILTEGIVRQGSFKKWLAAAAAVLIIVFGAVYLLSNNKPSLEKLYAEYAEHSPLKIQLRGAAADSIAQAAADRFNNKNYYEALPMLQAYLKQQPGDIQMEFSEGICQLELNNYKEAENIFNDIANGTSGYVESAKWYLALTALKQNNITECRNRLKVIQQTSSYYTKAEALLKKLPA